MLKTLMNCPLCGSGTISKRFVATCDRRADGRAWPIEQCDACSLSFLNPQPDWSELAPYYDAMYDAYEPDHSIETPEADAARARNSGEFRHIRISKGLRILDVGCGGGAFLRVARSLGAEVFGVEPSEYGVKSARAQGLPVFHGQLHEFIASDGAGRKFDVVTANHVVEHHPDPAALLGQMKSLLAPGGYVWFAVPNAASKTAAALKERWHSVDAPYHLMQFTPASAKLAAERAGLGVRRQYTYSLPSAAFASFCDIWRHRFFAPRTITQKLQVLRGVADRAARKMDAAGEGEAVIVEAVAA